MIEQLIVILSETYIKCTAEPRNIGDWHLFHGDV